MNLHIITGLIFRKKTSNDDNNKKKEKKNGSASLCDNDTPLSKLH